MLNSRLISAVAKLVALLWLALGALPALALATPDLLTPAERAWLAAHPRIVLGAGEDWMPYIVKRAGAPMSGFAVEQLDLINRQLGTQIRIEAGPWQNMVKRAEAGEIDGLTVTAPLDERRPRFDFTDPIAVSKDFVFLRTPDAAVAAGSAVTSTLDTLRGKRVGYLGETLRIQRLLAQVPGVSAVPVAGYAALAQQLVEGKIDAAVGGFSFEYWRASNGVVQIVPTRIIQETEGQLVMSIRKDRAPLVGILNKGLAAIDRDALDALRRRWFGVDYLSRFGTPTPSLTPEERAWLAAHPVLRVAVDPTWAPIEFIDADGAARGMSVAYLARLGDMLGLRFEFVPGATWTQVLARMDSRAIDLLPAIAANPQRLRQMAFTAPYLSFPAAIFSAADVAFIGGPGALKGKRVLVVRNEAVQHWLETAWPDIELVPADDTREALRQLADGQAVAFIGNLVTTSYYIGKFGYTQVKVAGETPFVYQLGMAVRPDWAILAGILQKGLDVIPAHERAAIYDEWISIRYEHRIDTTLLWTLAGVAALILLGVFAERSLRLKRSNTRLRHLARELSQVEERERHQLATRLHDSPMQKLALAQLQLSAAVAPGAATERLGSCLGLMQKTLEELQTLQFELSPPMLFQSGLAAALEWLAGHASARYGVAFSFQGEPVALPQEHAIVLFQCARELVYNVIKHAGARNGRIALSHLSERLVLKVEDDGRGFPSQAVKRDRPGGGFGLFSVRERLALLGGTLAIDSAPGRGCVSLQVPCPPPALVPASGLPSPPAQESA